jgi:hypothetical protein
MKLLHKAFASIPLAMLAFVVSCGHPMTLESIDISPSSVTITGAGSSLIGLPVHLTAYGNFINPTEKVDITDKVNWSVDFPQIATVSFNGVVTPTGNGSCGIVTVTATAGKGVVGPGTANVVVIGQATVNVIDTNQPNCP